ncbi:MAG: hypothetical protein ACXWCM_11705 [Acidimicrobiales bacterium]
MRSRLQLLLESVADDHPASPLLPGLGPKGIDEAHGDLVVLARACRAGARSLLADGVVPTATALTQRLCRLRQFGEDSVGVAITEVTESLCGDAGIDHIVEGGSRVVMLALAESLIGISQLLAAPTGDAPSTMLAMLLDAARSVDRPEGARRNPPASDRPGERDDLDDAEREAS